MSGAIMVKARVRLLRRVLVACVERAGFIFPFQRHSARGTVFIARYTFRNVRIGSDRVSRHFSTIFARVSEGNVIIQVRRRSMFITSFPFCTNTTGGPFRIFLREVSYQKRNLKLNDRRK